ncbi:MAG: hypothetical protein NTV87_15520 [Ignavibacteriae bacterium]|nr:hypothetical protein [Ignavibacteriota bacterium]
MKKIVFTVVLILFCVSASFSQRVAWGDKYYAGFGFSLDFFTNSDVNYYYNGIGTNNAQSVSDINFSFGVNLNRHFAVEFAPAFVFTPSSSYGGGPFNYWDDDPYWWYDDSPTGTTYQNTYTLSNAYLFAIPLNLKLKYYPLKNYGNDFGEGLNLNLSLGAMYIYESFTGTGGPTGGIAQPFSISGSTWAPDAVLGLGYNYYWNNTGLGFDVNYRFVPMSLSRKSPLSYANASNFNSLNFSLYIGFAF